MGLGANLPPPITTGELKGEEEEGRKSGVGSSLLVVLVWMAARERAERWC